MAAFLEISYLNSTPERGTYFWNPMARLQTNYENCERSL